MCHMLDNVTLGNISCGLTVQILLGNQHKQRLSSNGISIKPADLLRDAEGRAASISSTQVMAVLHYIARCASLIFSHTFTQADILQGV
ncbi:hypothetical protein GDO78_005995 [Eleutherodactylus coqui]|uniref:Uncharacterized protein n=1 Tax=Eleutherodactylus coqui TaxID=57060 RepID=A0A8J6FP09_ELECQ|nr:hypothetical protein GDO78_005995 [Eleutherodactylus coqui]